MFADYGKLRVRRIVKAVTKPAVRMTKVITKPLVNISSATGKVGRTIIKTATKPLIAASTAALGVTGGIVAAATGKLIKPKQQTSEEAAAGIQTYVDEYGNPVDKDGYLLPNMSIKPIGPYAWDKFSGQWINTASQGNLSIPQPQQEYQPQIQAQSGQQYAAPMQQTDYYKQEQRQPEDSYYSEQKMPVEEGSPMSDQFDQMTTEDTYEMPQGDYGDLGLDEDTVLLLNEAATAGSQTKEAIAAGQNYVDKIQGKTNTVGEVVPASAPDDKTGIPTWMWIALGGAILLAVSSGKKKTKKSRRFKR